MRGEKLEVSYNRNIKESYMIITGETQWDSYEKQMLLENQLLCLLEFYTVELNGEQQFWYDISGRESLKDYWEREISMERIEKVFRYLGYALEELKKYLISWEHIVLLPETIFIKQVGQPFGICLCYYPQKEAGGLEKIVELLLSQVEVNQEELLDLCYELYEVVVVSKGNCDMILDCIQQAKEKKEETKEKVLEGIVGEEEIGQEKIKLQSTYTLEEWDELEEAEEECDNTQEHGANLFLTIKERVLHKGDEIKKVVCGWIHNTKPSNEQHLDFVIEPQQEVYEPTVFLGQGEATIRGRLVYNGKEQEESFLLTEGEFFIGSSKENQGRLMAKTVSKRHAKIYHKKEGYYIEDMNSTNGTFVNDKLLSYRNPVLLRPMDKILFADVPYLFM